MHPPKPTPRITIGANIHRNRGMKAQRGKREQRLEKGWHAGNVEYIPCLATISIGQDRKNTIEGSSATDKDYPKKQKW